MTLKTSKVSSPFCMSLIILKRYHQFTFLVIELIGVKTVLPLVNLEIRYDLSENKVCFP